MAEKRINTRIVHKHETDANWKLSSLVPMQGELIVYDIDNDYNYERIKLGDGVKNVDALPFVDEALRAELLEQIGAVDDKVSAVSTLVGDTAVSEQINTAIEGAKADATNKDIAVLAEAQKAIEAAKLEASNQDDVILAEAQKDIAAVSALVGNTSVAEQITAAIASKSDANHNHDSAYVTKTELNVVSTLVGDTSVAEQIDDALLNKQPDMLQNDSTKVDYIKNRTHWKEEFGVRDLFNGTVDVEYGWNAVQGVPIAIEIKTGATYSVVYDGATYEMVGKVGADGVPYIGSYSLWSNASYVETEEPFCYGDGWFAATTDAAHTVVISGEDTEWHAMEKEYIPGVLIRPGDGYKSEIFNDLNNTASGTMSHAEGAYTSADGDYSHVEGYSSVASGISSHAEGMYTVAASPYQHVQGKYNIIDEDFKYVHIVGNGNSNTNRSNVHTLDWHGHAWFSGDIRVGGTKYEQGTSVLPISTEVTLSAANWTGDSSPWSQRVTISGVGMFSKVDLQPSAEQVVELQSDGVMFMIENDLKTTTAYAIGNKPTKDYTMQVLITGVTPA